MKNFNKIVYDSEWESGGFAPWQAVRRFNFNGIKYTLYIRERHDVESVHIMWGHDGINYWGEYQHYVDGPPFTRGLLSMEVNEEIESIKDTYKRAEAYAKVFMEGMSIVLPVKDPNQKSWAHAKVNQYMWKNGMIK